MRNKGYLPQLDVLRGIAILLVFACHTATHLPPSPIRDLACKGWTGVDLFFVLSGFLITDILLNSRGSRNYFQVFYMRRALRIWPLYFGLLVVSFFLIPAISATMREQVRAAGPGWIYAVFLQNVVPYMRPAPLVVTWSLAVEEQFYVLWSLMVFKITVRHLKCLFAALFIVAPLLRILALHYGVTPDFIYFNLFHYDGLVAGSLIALFGVHQRGRTESLYAGLASLAMGGGIIAFAGIPGRIEEILNVFTYSGIALLGTGLVLLAFAMPWRGWIQRLEPIRLTGKISYCLYLVHYPILSAAFVARTKFGLNSAPRTALIVAAALITSYAVATFSWIYIERPVLALKRYFEYRQMPVLERAAA